MIGAGFIGAEVASTAAKLGLDVTVVEAALAPLAGPLGVQLGAAVARLHTEHGTRLLCGAPVAGLTGSDRVTGVELADGRRAAPPTSSLVGIGAIPNIEWLRDSPIELANGVVCDAGGATSVPNVVAVGDCAAWHEPSVGWPHRVEHWTGALERPAIAVATLLAAGGTTARRPNPRTSGPISTTAASSSPASPIPAMRSPSRWAARATPASWPCTAATANRSPCSAWTNRSCSPDGVANWPSSPFPPDFVFQQRRSR